MADFEKACGNTLLHEGGYAFDPDDAGGETYCGVSRRFHPAWSGWTTIDALKDQASGKRQLHKLLRENAELNTSVQRFYKQHYWDRFQGDLLPDQALAEELFDTAVNMGVHSAVRFLQESLNLLNRNQKNFADILEDGLSGPQTLKTLDNYLQKDPAEYLLKIMNILQGMHYIDFMRKSPVQEKYARGWLKRVTIGNRPNQPT